MPLRARGRAHRRSRTGPQRRRLPRGAAPTTWSVTRATVEATPIEKTIEPVTRNDEARGGLDLGRDCEATGGDPGGAVVASAPGGRGWFGSAGAMRRPGSSGCGTWRSSSSHAGARSVPTGVHANVLAGVPLSVPQADRAGSAVLQTFASPSATSGDQWRCRPDRNSGDAGGRLAGAWHERFVPPFTRAFTSPSPEPAPDAGTVTCLFTTPSPTPGGSPTAPAGVHLVVPQTRAAGGPTRWPSPPRTPAQLTSATTRTGERWEALALYHLAALLFARGAGLEPATTGSKGRRSTN
jgi:hypothetical protein